MWSAVGTRTPPATTSATASLRPAIAATGGDRSSADEAHAYLTQHHYTQWVSYLPNSWFWHCQILEATGYTVLAALLAVATVFRLRRRAV